MASSEFDIIAKYFDIPSLTSLGEFERPVSIGIGDDCALLDIPAGKQLAVSMDVLVANVHFPANADAKLIAQRALAVNISDLAAMGAKPVAFTLGLTLPSVDDTWLAAFSQGLGLSAQDNSCVLMGGDLSKGAMTICIQVHGWVDTGKALLRSGALPGDRVYITGVLGEAGLALELLENKLGSISKQDRDILHNAYYQPASRVHAGQAGIGLASAAIDVSDGVLADIGHIAKRSGVAIKLAANALPLSEAVIRIAGHARALQYALSAGDEYELVFTVPEAKVKQFKKAMAQVPVKISCIGTVMDGAGVIYPVEDITVLQLEYQKYLVRMVPHHYQNQTLKNEWDYETH